MAIPPVHQGKLTSLRERLGRIRDAESEGARAAEELRKLDEQMDGCREELVSHSESHTAISLNLGKIQRGGGDGSSQVC